VPVGNKTGLALIPLHYKFKQFTDINTHMSQRSHYNLELIPIKKYQKSNNNTLHAFTVRKCKSHQISGYMNEVTN